MPRPPESMLLANDFTPTPHLIDQHSRQMTFRELLSELGQEHESKIASLEKEIHALHEKLGGNANKSMTEPLVLCVKKDAAPHGLVTSMGETRGMKKQYSSMSDGSFGAIYEAPSINLSLGELPEEGDMGTRIIETFSRSPMGRMFGCTKEKAGRFSAWWKNLREPERPAYCGLRDCIDGKRFRSFIVSCIMLNAAYIIYTTEVDIDIARDDPRRYNSMDTNAFRLAIESGFTLIYTIEILMKIYVHRAAFFYLEDWRWNVFDSALVVFAIFDTCTTFILLEDRSQRPNLTFLRSLRIMRVSKIMRALRAIRSIQELRVMLDCVINSMLHLVWCVVLIVFVLLFFSLIFIQGVTHHLAAAHSEGSAQFEEAKEDIETHFDTIPNAMLRLFEATTGGEDWQTFYDIIAKSGDFYAVVFLFYIAFFCIVAWNIVMSTFVEKTFKLCIPDIETMMMEKRRKDLCYSKELFEIITSRLDENHSGTISFAEFKEHFNDPELTSWFEAREFDMKDAELFFHMLASVNKKKEVDVTTFVLGCMRLRGTASNIDLQALHYDVRKMFNKQSRALHQLSQQFHSSLGNEFEMHGGSQSSLNIGGIQQESSACRLNKNDTSRSP